MVPSPGCAENPPTPDLNRVLPLKIAAYPALQQEGGSVMLTHDGGTTVLLINRGPGDALFVLDPACRHAGCRVECYDKVSREIFCSCHGSTYAIDGAVTKGPATTDLLPYPSRFSGGVLEVELPEFEFGITALSPVRTTGGSPRLALTFPTKNLASYRIRRSTDAASPFQPASFATERDSLLDQTQLAGDGDVRTVYVDATSPRAFYLLELMVFELG
jgi:nitrite reductase/ring-hydroxylating ferredoxin subunit